MGLFDSATKAVGEVVPDLDVRKLLVVVDLVWEHRDQLVSLLTMLPRALADAGDSMHTAGVGAQQAGGILRGEVRTIALDAAATLEACRQPLHDVTEVVDQIGNLLDRLPLVGNVADPFTRGLRAIGEVSDNIDTVLVQVRELGERLGDVGTGLDAMGRSLETGGTALTTLSGREVLDRVAPRSPGGPGSGRAGSPAPAPAPAPKGSTARGGTTGRAGDAGKAGAAKRSGSTRKAGTGGTTGRTAKTAKTAKTRKAASSGDEA